MAIAFLIYSYNQTKRQDLNIHYDWWKILIFECFKFDALDQFKGKEVARLFSKGVKNESFKFVHYLVTIVCIFLFLSFLPTNRYVKNAFKECTTRLYIRPFLENIVRCGFYNGRAYITKLTKANLSKDRTSLLTSLQESQGE